MRVKATPYDGRPSEKVLYPAAIQASAALALAIRRGPRDRATLAVAGCTVATAVIGFLALDNRFEALRQVVIATAGQAKELGGDGWDGDQPEKTPPGPSENDQHPPDVDGDPAACSTS